MQHENSRLTLYHRHSCGVDACAAQAKEAEEKIHETQEKREEFEEQREHLNAKSREAARAIAQAKESEAAEAKLASSAKAHQKIAENEETAAARVSGRLQSCMLCHVPYVLQNLAYMRAAW